jgi:hypothetical protein
MKKLIKQIKSNVKLLKFSIDQSYFKDSDKKYILMLIEEIEARINSHEIKGKKIKIKEIMFLFKCIEEYSAMVAKQYFQPTQHP